MKLTEMLVMLLPVFLIQFGFVAFTVFVWLKHESNHMSKWIWLAIVCIALPFGPLAYLILGKGERYDYD